MKYTVNINQKAIVDLGLQDKLDFIDLAIYDFITEFMLCDECRKLNIDNVQYFWIKSDFIIENLPLLGITTTRGVSKRIDKLIDCGLLERCPDNHTLHQSFYKVGKLYNEYKFFTKNENSKGAWNENSKNNNSIPYTKDTITDNKITDNKKEEGIIIPSKKNDYQEIIDCWNEYNGKSWGKVLRLGAKRKRIIKSALDNQGITQEELMRLFKTFPYADSWLFHPTKEHKDWKPDFDWWMRDTNGWLTKALEGKVHNANPQAFNDIMQGGETNATYTPQGRTIWYDELTKTYWTDDNFYYGVVSDGYTDDNRPDGATLTMSNARGDIKWNANTKKWEKK